MRDKIFELLIQSSNIENIEKIRDIFIEIEKNKVGEPNGLGSSRFQPVHIDDALSRMKYITNKLKEISEINYQIRESKKLEGVSLLTYDKLYLESFHDASLEILGILDAFFREDNNVLKKDFLKRQD